MGHDAGHAFDTPDRYGTWSVQWDGVADRFGVDGLPPEYRRTFRVTSTTVNIHKAPVR